MMTKVITSGIGEPARAHRRPSMAKAVRSATPRASLTQNGGGPKAQKEEQGRTARRAAGGSQAEGEPGNEEAREVREHLAGQLNPPGSHQGDPSEFYHH